MFPFKERTVQRLQKVFLLPIQDAEERVRGGRRGKAIEELLPLNSTPTRLGRYLRRSPPKQAPASFSTDGFPARKDALVIQRKIRTQRPMGSRRGHREPPIDPSFQDPLTGLYNERFLEVLLSSYWSELFQPGRSVALVLLEVASYRQVISDHGVLAGDDLLRSVTNLLLHCTRHQDQVMRVQGDQFALVLPGVDEARTRTLIHRIRENVSPFLFFSPTHRRIFTLPIRLLVARASFPRDPAAGPELFNLARKRLRRMEERLENARRQHLNELEV
jgi:diguanylate cyclase (GGDEF)-like protein